MDVGQVGEVWRMCHIACMKLADLHLGSLAPEKNSIEKNKRVPPVLESQG